MATIEMLGPLRNIGGDGLMGSLGRCKSLREILSSLLTVLRADPDFGRPASMGDLQSYLIVLVNGTVADQSSIDMELGEADRIVILTLSHGG